MRVSWRAQCGSVGNQLEISPNCGKSDFSSTNLNIIKVGVEFSLLPRVRARSGDDRVTSIAAVDVQYCSGGSVSTAPGDDGSPTRRRGSQWRRRAAERSWAPGTEVPYTTSHRWLS